MTSISGAGGGASSLIQMLQQRFQQADTDGDDALSLDEFSAAAPQGGPGGPQGLNAGGAPPDPSEIFSKADADGNGSLSESEFKSVFENMGHGTKSALIDVQELFSKADANGDGSVSEDEFAAAAPKGPPPNGGAGGPPPGPPPSGSGDDEDALSSIFDALDANGDGSLSEDEFASALDGSQDSASSDADAQILNLLKQAADLYSNSAAQSTNSAQAIAA